MSRKRKKPAKRPIPRFQTEDQERDFWARHDVVDYFDWDKAVKGSFRALKPSGTMISERVARKRQARRRARV